MFDDTCHSVIEIQLHTENPREPTYEVICSADGKKSDMYFYFLDLAKTPYGKEWFVACNTSGMTSTSNRQFIRITRKY